MIPEDLPHGASVQVSPAQAAFIDFMCESGVLTFGDFTTKSGRKTPYFVNTGLYSTGAQMATLGDAYAEAALERFGNGFDVLFGPAYKGIPLVVSTAAALHRREGRDVPLVFNRKEAKDHGEGGVLVGHRLKDGDRVLILEDVTTAGTSIRETVPLLRAAAKVEIAGLLVSVDRMERGPSGDGSALTELSVEFSMPTAALVDLNAILGHLAPGGGSPHALGADQIEAIGRYREQYGAR